MSEIVSIILRHWVPAILMAAGAYILATLPSAYPDDPNPPQPEGIDKNPPAVPLGQWRNREPGVAYRAESDGFVAVHTHGKKPASGFRFYTGWSEELKDLRIRTRGQRYDGSVCPVTEGEWWLVRYEGPREGITVQWMPVSRSQGSAPAPS